MLGRLRGLQRFSEYRDGVTEEAAKGTTSHLLNIFPADVLSEEKASLVLDEPQSRCNEKYLEREPSRTQLLIYQSLFSTMEPGGVLYVDLASLGSALNESTLQFLSGLLSKHFASLTTKQAETDAGLIIALTQGLLHQNPSVDFGDIRLSMAANAQRRLLPWRRI